MCCCDDDFSPLVKIQSKFLDMKELCQGSMFFSFHLRVWCAHRATVFLISFFFFSFPKHGLRSNSQPSSFSFLLFLFSVCTSRVEISKRARQKNVVVIFHKRLSSELRVALLPCFLTLIMGLMDDFFLSHSTKQLFSFVFILFACGYSRVNLRTIALRRHGLYHSRKLHA